MPRKQSKFVVVNGRIPEWGVSPLVSTAVPIAASGTEIKSTRGVSESMYTVLRARLNELRDKEGLAKKDVDELRTIVIKDKKEKPRGTFFKVSSPRSGVFVTGRSSRSGAVVARSGTIPTRRDASRVVGARKRG